MKSIYFFNLLTIRKKYDIILVSSVTTLSKIERGDFMDNTVTCSFVLDRDIYNAYKSIVSRSGENVKGNLVRYMESVIKYDNPNADTILAIKEVQELKKNPNKKIYNSFSEILEELDEDE